MKKVVYEITWFSFITLISFILLPLIIIWMDLRTAQFNINKLEQLFLTQMLFIIFFLTVLALYIFRFLITMLLSKYFKTDEKGKP